VNCTTNGGKEQQPTHWHWVEMRDRPMQKTKAKEAKPHYCH
jgi:hypothetical protein